jgi:hypothetical protein
MRSREKENREKKKKKEGTDGDGRGTDERSGYLYRGRAPPGTFVPVGYQVQMCVWFVPVGYPIQTRVTNRYK